MSSKNEEKGQAAADRIKAAALTAAKGLSRAQAERAAAAATRNVNAYGQKEEGPSRWQERKEAKRQMYLMSTEKAVKLGERKDIKGSVSTASGGQTSQCQKCFQPGHWTYECKNERVYMSRPSRTQQLKNPKLKMTLSVSYDLDTPDVGKGGEKSEKAQKKEKGEKKGKSKRKHRARSDSDSEDSVFGSDSESSVTESSDESSTSYSSSDSEERRRRRRRTRKKQKKRGHRYSSSSSDDSSDSESDSASNRADKSSRRKSSSRRKPSRKR